MSYKIIFAGTPEFAIPSLQMLLDSQYEIAAVYTQPDRKAGRGQKLTASPIKVLALQNHLTIHQPMSLRDPEEQKKLAAYQPDVMIVAAYGLILPKAVLAIPRFGCINVHGSLLPRWRGAAPIQRAIQAGDVKTGITIMQMDVGLDTGKMLKKCEVIIGENETSAELLPRLATAGATVLKETLPDLPRHQANAETQDEQLATYAHKLNKSETPIDWNQSAAVIHNQIRAFNPWPVATMQFQNETVRVWNSRLSMERSSAAPGTLISVKQDELHMQTGDGVLLLTELQLPGGKRVAAREFIQRQQGRSFER